LTSPAAYRVGRSGAGNDFELGPRSEHAVEIIILESLARMDATYRMLEFQGGPENARLAEAVKNRCDKKAGPFLTLPLSESEPSLESITEKGSKKLQTGGGVVLVFPHCHEQLECLHFLPDNALISNAFLFVPRTSCTGKAVRR